LTGQIKKFEDLAADDTGERRHGSWEKIFKEIWSWWNA